MAQKKVDKRVKKEPKQAKQPKKSKRDKRETEENGGEKVKYYPRSFLWNILSISLAFLFGIFAALGGLLGVGIVFGTKKPVKDILGENYLNYVREDYADASLYDLMKALLGTVSELAGSGGAFTFQSINKITPILENILVPMSDGFAEQGIMLDVDELMNTPVSDFGSYLRTTIVDNTLLANFVNPDINKKSDALMLAICYGEEGVDYTVENGEIVMSEGKKPITLGEFIADSNAIVRGVTVEAALGITATSNAAMRYLAYGTEGTNYLINEDGKIEMLVNSITQERFRKKKLSDLTNDSSSPIEDAKISDLLEVNENTSSLIKAIRNWKISDLKQQSRIERLKISQVINLGDNPSRLMKAIADWRIKELNNQSRIDSLTLSDVIKIDENSPKILQTLQTAQLGELDDRANRLRILDMLSEEDIESNKILRNLSHSTLKTLSRDIKNITVRDVFGKELYSYMEITDEKPSYAELVKKYSEEYKLDPSKSEIHPTAIPSNATVTTHYKVGGTELSGGWVTQIDEEVYELLKKSNVNRVITRDEETGADIVSYFTEHELNLSPVVALKRVDYDNKGELVDAQYGTETIGADGTVPSVQGTPYLDSEGNQLYYYTDREKYVPESAALARLLDDEIPTDPADPADPTDPNDPTDPTDPTEPEAPKKEMEAVYYPLMQDENGIYCIAMTIDGNLERTDFEEKVTHYLTDSEEEIAPGEKYGIVIYNDVEMRLYTHAAVVVDDVEIEAERYYVLTKADAFYAYYDETAVWEEEPVQLVELDGDEGEGENQGEGEGDDDPEEPEVPEVTKYVARVYEEADVTISWTATWTEGGETDPTLHENVAVDRYLSGAWWLIFGNEISEDSENGKTRTEVDNTNHTMLEINKEVTAATSILKELELWELYFHGFISKNPFCDLSRLGKQGNLNTRTLDEVVELFKELTSNP